MQVPTSSALFARRSLVTVSLLACGIAAQAQQAGTLAPSPASISDQTIGADRAGYEALQGEVRKRHAAGASVAQPMLAKAQCWIDVSFHEYSRNERDDFPAAALKEAQTLIAQFDKSPNAAMAPTPLIAGAVRLREDLWQRAAGIVGNPSQQCAAARAACAEVALVHAGHEDAAYGWRSARPYVGIAEDAVSSASALAATCNPPPVAKPAAVTPPPVLAQPAPVALPQAPVKRRIALATDTLFDYDKWDLKMDKSSSNKGQGWKSVLPQIRKEFGKVESVRVFGYTDRLGSDAHNDPLSWRRANAVVQALKGEGLTEVTIEAYGMGKREPKAECVGEKRTPALKACLQPSRRVEIEVTGWPK